MIEISKKSDLVVPFTTFGSDNWEEQSQLIIDSIVDIWEDEPEDKIEPSRIDELEKRLDTTLPEELKTFYLKFGLANIGERFQQLDEIGKLEDIWKDEPQYGPGFTEEDKKHLPYLITFAESGGGNLFCFHTETKEIFLFDHDTQSYISKLFDHAGDYLKACLIRCQTDLRVEGLEMGDVEEWIEDLLVDIYGEEVVDKWLY